MAFKKHSIRLGTRGSPLALKQVEMVRAALKQAHPSLEIETAIIKTSGDWKRGDAEVRLEEGNGGKALFAKEIEEALLRGEIDAGIHSMKDLQTFLPDGLIVNHMLPREDARDVLIAHDANVKTISDLPRGARIGTCSLRRQAFLLAKRPDLKIEILRGNVQTRLDKLRKGQVDATLLAGAGLKRLGLDHEIKNILSLEDMLPAAGQGAIGIEIREGDKEITALFDGISHLKTLLCVKAERAALAALNGDCHTPVGAHAVISGNQLHLRLALATPDGAHIYTDEAGGPVEQAENIGFELGEKIKARIPSNILQQIL
ncbi:MAG: hydroxymethylbilane synthase [Alphaproteobacteria bacterium]